MFKVEYFLERFGKIPDRADKGVMLMSIEEEVVGQMGYKHKHFYLNIKEKELKWKPRKH